MANAKFFSHLTGQLLEIKKSMKGVVDAKGKAVAEVTANGTLR